MLDLLAAISSVDPPSFVAWAVLVFAAGMYPLGIMLGSSCSPCCASPLPCQPEVFAKCRRDTCLTCSPQEGLSTRVSRIARGTRPGTLDPSDQGEYRPGTGCVAVCAIQRLRFTLAGTQFINLRLGENLSITATQGTTASPGGVATMARASQPETIFPSVLTVNFIGVDVPLIVSSATLATTSRLHNASFSSFVDTDLGTSARASVNAPVSVVTRAVAIETNGQFFDGNVVTESALLSRLTWSVAYQTSNRFRLSYSYTPDASFFQYLPLSTTARIAYTIEIKRGTASIYRRFVLNVSKQTGSTVTPLPEGGLPALSLPTYTLTDTPNTQTPPVVNGATITLWSNSAVQAVEDYLHKPTVWGEHFVSLTQTVSPSTHAAQIVREVSCVSTRHVFDPREQGINALVSSRNMNYDEVDEFLRGERCLQWIGNGIATIGGGVSGQTMRRCLEPPREHCGARFSNVSPSFESGVYPANAVGTALQQGVTIGQVAEFWWGGPYVARLDGYQYFFKFSFYDVGGANFTRQYLFTISLSEFYKGDLLWALENGPYRTTIAPVPPALVGGSGGTTPPDSSLSLGGNAEADSVFIFSNQSTVLRQSSASASPTAFPWQGGTASVTGEAFPISALPVLWTGRTFSGTAPVAAAPMKKSTSPIETYVSAGGNASTGINSASWFARAKITQQPRPCGSTGIFTAYRFASDPTAVVTPTRTTQGFLGTGETVGMFNLFATDSGQGMPDNDCDNITATTTASWITIEPASPGRSFCIRFAANTTGAMRSAAIQFSSVYVLSGVPSTSSSATLGNFNYMVFQPS
jgi:hypothetical protein